ncbi:MAG: YegS/Rv2252/BmrU family lipid kinase [Clostridia bacterium]|nr:YegS/Rv2252/BmrU family lipid kinase [Clostridia bacterium]
MKTVFIVNPKAGKKRNIDDVVSAIRQAAKKHQKDIDIYITKAVGDGERFVREYCKANGAARFIACGGDGTLNEVANGAFGFVAAEVGVMPLGTGNDFCRNFSQRHLFPDAEAQLFGKAIPCDVIEYTTECGGESVTRYCMNMFNIGFDCNVADMTATMKQKPFISGSLAYFLSIFTILIKKKGANLAIVSDGVEKHRGPLLLNSIANGSFCGGGIKSNPTANVQDGIMDVNIVYNISRLNFLTKLPFYMKGTHIKLQNIEKVIAAHTCKEMTVTPLEGIMRLCVDGEITNAGKTEFKVVPGGISFVVPFMPEEN